METFKHAGELWERRKDLNDNEMGELFNFLEPKLIWLHNELSERCGEPILDRIGGNDNE